MSDILPLSDKDKIPYGIQKAAEKIVNTRINGSPVVMFFGAHVIRSGVQRYIIDLMEKGFITCIAMNGACMIHDFEFALCGQTTESVRKYIEDGRFGFWQETARINDIVTDAAHKNIGLGEAIGKSIAHGDYPHKDISIFAAAQRLNVLTTVHVGIGFDITHQNANCDGAAYGAASYTDFLRFARVLESIDEGLVSVFGSAVMAPEVFLKALSMARNVARQKSKRIHRFTTLVCDLYPLPDDYHEEASRDSASYYFRPWKTLLIRTVAEGGNSFYVRGAHKDTIPALWTAIHKLL